MARPLAGAGRANPRTGWRHALGGRRINGSTEPGRRGRMGLRGPTPDGCDAVPVAPSLGLSGRCRDIVRPATEVREGGLSTTSSTNLST